MKIIYSIICIQIQQIQSQIIFLLPFCFYTELYTHSGSSFSSTNSQQVRIKAKYLKQIKSPFDTVYTAQPGSPTGQVPPALPGNRPPGYDEKKKEESTKTAAQSHHQTRRHTKEKDGGHHQVESLGFVTADGNDSGNVARFMSLPNWCNFFNLYYNQG